MHVHVELQHPLFPLQYVVADNGSLDGVGLIDARAAKMQRINGVDTTCAVSLEVGQ